MIHGNVKALAGTDQLQAAQSYMEMACPLLEANEISCESTEDEWLQSYHNCYTARNITSSEADEEAQEFLIELNIEQTCNVCKLFMEFT